MGYHVENLLKEVSLPYRLKIIECLKDGIEDGKEWIRLSELYKRLKANGIEVPTSTVYRAVSNLSAAGIIDKKNGEVSLTPAGILLIDSVECMERLMGFEYLELATDFLLSLPPELRFGVHYLSKCEKVDPVEFGAKNIEFIEKTQEEGKFVTDIAEMDIFKAVIRSRLKGAHHRMVFSEESIQKKIKTLAKASKDLGLGKYEIECVQARVEYRILKVPVQMAVLDSDVGVLVLGVKHFVPFFVTFEKNGIRWLDSIFDYYWDQAKPLGEVFEGGEKGFTKMILKLAIGAE
ncbi:MAG: transcriptional repressor [Archaeoglobus sp.]|nr:transcriptional repressor [Archaeoglobus sp.]